MRDLARDLDDSGVLDRLQEGRLDLLWFEWRISILFAKEAAYRHRQTPGEVSDVECLKVVTLLMVKRKDSQTNDIIRDAKPETSSRRVSRSWQ